MSRVLFSLFFLFSSLSAETWIINSRVEVTAPRDVEDVLVTDGGYLVVSGVGEPGFRISGNFIVEKTGQAELRDSVIKVMSRFHGQYFLAALNQGRLLIDRCQYEVPYGVQQAIASMDTAQVEIKDTRFGFLQLVPFGRSRISASRLTGNFECVVSDSARLELSDIPAQPGAGTIWVWPTFMPGTTAVYSPPLPGYINHFVFPPQDSSGIEQSFSIDRCMVQLWPLLVREDTRLTLANIAPENWVVVGLHLPQSATITGLTNRLSYDDEVLPLSDRTLRLVNATIDTWSLYPQKEAQVTVRNCLIGELIAQDSSQVDMEGTIVDGTGGYFGASQNSFLTATAASSPATCRPSARPGWPSTRASSCPIILMRRALTHSSAFLTRLLSTLTRRFSRRRRSWAALYSLDPTVSLLSWSLRLFRRGTHSFTVIGSGIGNRENGYLGTWQNAAPDTHYELRLTLRDSLMRKHEGRIIYY